VSISDIGTCARITVVMPRVSMPEMRPRRPFKSPIKSPAKSLGAWTSTFMMGSRIVGRARVIASLKASEPAILNESSFESTA